MTSDVYRFTRASRRPKGEKTRELLQEALLKASIIDGELLAGERKRMLYCVLLPNRLLRFADSELSASRGHIALDTVERVEDHYAFQDGNPAERDLAFEMILFGQKDQFAGVHIATSKVLHCSSVQFSSRIARGSARIT